MWCRGIRGATTVDRNTQQEILAATGELLRKMIDANEFEAGDVACVIFSTTPDLDAAFPATAAQQLGWTNVALLCGHEINVPDSLPMCLRILVLVNTEKSAEEMVHVYLKGARNLRPDRARS